jgi:dienelactone hydrolase
MEATSGHSAACCNIPPIISKGYEAKGKYETVDGLKTYITGPPTATTALLFIHDIFGFFPQSLQGADILSSSHTDSKYLVFMPDFFEGSPADISWYPPDNEDKQQKLGAFFKGPGDPGKAAKRVPEVVKALGEKYPGVKSWGVIGFCWGGKIVSLTTGTPSTPFVAAAECHPAMVEPADALNISIPLILLASKDEDAEAVKKFEANLKGEKYVETFGDQIHGWMGARSDLENSRVKEEYERGYKTVVEFFGKYLT